jgi:hypothetical protein
MTDHASPVVLFGIPVLAVVVATLFLAAAYVSHAREGAGTARRTTAKAALGVAALFIVPGGLALSGLLADVTRRPPLFMPMMLSVVGLAALAAASPFGTLVGRLPLAALVGAQAFRLPLEFVMREAAREGVMPVQMSFEGYNFDVLTGAFALVLGVVLHFREVSRTVLLAWNALGALLLFNVVTIAVVSMPWFAAFGKGRTSDWVLHFPFVYLPAVLVAAALFGHIVTFRRLLSESRIAAPRTSAPRAA